MKAWFKLGAKRVPKKYVYNKKLLTYPWDIDKGSILDDRSVRFNLCKIID